MTHTTIQKFAVIFAISVICQSAAVPTANALSCMAPDDFELFDLGARLPEHPVFFVRRSDPRKQLELYPLDPSGRRRATPIKLLRHAKLGELAFGVTALTPAQKLVVGAHYEIEIPAVRGRPVATRRFQVVRSIAKPSWPMRPKIKHISAHRSVWRHPEPLVNATIEVGQPATKALLLARFNGHGVLSAISPQGEASLNNGDVCGGGNGLAPTYQRGKLYLVAADGSLSKPMPIHLRYPKVR